MIKLFRPLELPPQLNWKFADKPALMEWAIRARNYNTTVANCIFAFMTALISLLTYIGHSSKTFSSSSFSELLVSTLFFTSLLLTISTMTHQKMNYAYRFTLSGLEYCEWKDFPKWALPVLRWMIGITGIIFLYMATVDPAFLIGALVGPGGMGLMYLRMAYSKSYRDLHTEYHHYFLDWGDLTLVIIANNRYMIELSYNTPKPDSNRRSIGRQYVFFQKTEKQKVIDLIKLHLPESTPCRVGHVNVLN